WRWECRSGPGRWPGREATGPGARGGGNWSSLGVLVGGVQVEFQNPHPASPWRRGRGGSSLGRVPWSYPSPTLIHSPQGGGRRWGSGRWFDRRLLVGECRGRPSEPPPGLPLKEGEG